MPGARGGAQPLLRLAKRGGGGRGSARGAGLGNALVNVFDDHQRRYGTRRLRVELRELGHQVGRQAIRTALRRQARKALQPKAFVPRTTDSTHGKWCAPNLLLDQPKPTQANRVWVSDITYLPLANGNWVYCGAFQDVCTKQVVGWQVRADMP